MKCEACPVKLGPCVGEAPSHAFACAMAARGTDAELRWIADESIGRPPVATNEAAARRPKVDHAELRNATRLGSRNCWFSSQDAGCGCDGLLCHLLNRRINIHDCVECLKKW